jgi:hypothetical protein
MATPSTSEEGSQSGAHNRPAPPPPPPPYKPDRDLMAEGKRSEELPRERR